MAVQNAINQGIGALGTALAVSEHLGQQKKAAELEAVKEGNILNTESTDIIKESKALQDEFNKNAQELMDSYKDIKSVEAGEWSGPFRDEKGKYTTKDKYLQLKELRRKEVFDRQDAIRIEKQDLANRMEMYNKRIDAVNAIKKGVAPELNKKLPTEYENAVEWVKGGNK